LILFGGLRYNNGGVDLGAQTNRPCRVAPVSVLLGGEGLTGYIFVRAALRAYV